MPQENSHRPQIILKPCKAWTSYREMLLWFSVQTILPVLESIPDANSEPFEMQWENLGGFLVRQTKLDHLLQKIEQGSIQSWEELHNEYRALSEEYEEDARAFAWHILGYLSLNIEQAARLDAELASQFHCELANNLDALSAASNAPRSMPSAELSAPADHAAPFATSSVPVDCAKAPATLPLPLNRAASWPQPNPASLKSLLQAFCTLSSEIAERVYSTRAKDWENPFRKATFRNQAEQLAVHGRVEDNGDIKAFQRESEAIRQKVGRVVECWS